MFFPIDSRRKVDRRVFCCSGFSLSFFGVELFFFGIVIFVRGLMRSGYFGMVGSAWLSVAWLSGMDVFPFSSALAAVSYTHLTLPTKRIV